MRRRDVLSVEETSLMQVAMIGVAVNMSLILTEQMLRDIIAIICLILLSICLFSEKYGTQRLMKNDSEVR
jgi:hypothetical protein